MAHARTGRNHQRAWQPRTPPADRDTYRRRKDDLADIVAYRVDSGQRDDELTEQIRILMAQLRECRTPTERRDIELQVLPLLRERRSLNSWFPEAV